MAQSEFDAYLSKIGIDNRLDKDVHKLASEKVGKRVEEELNTLALALGVDSPTQLEIMRKIYYGAMKRGISGTLALMIAYKESSFGRQEDVSRIKDANARKRVNRANSARRNLFQITYFKDKNGKVYNYSSFKRMDIEQQLDIFKEFLEKKVKGIGYGIYGKSEKNKTRKK